MAKRTAFNHLLSTLTGISNHQINRAGTVLSKAGMIESGGRGFNAPDITPRDAATILLAVIGTDNASRAVETVEKLSLLESSRGRTFRGTLEEILTNVDLARTVSSITIYWNYLDACIEWFENPFEAMPHDDEGFPFHKIRSECFQVGIDNGDPAWIVTGHLKGYVLFNIVDIIYVQSTIEQRTENAE